MVEFLRIRTGGSAGSTGGILINLPFAKAGNPAGNGNPSISHGQADLYGIPFPSEAKQVFWEVNGATTAQLYYSRTSTNLDWNAR